MMVGDRFLDLLKTLCGSLDELGLPYALTGSVVSSTYGEPQTSQGVDVRLRMDAEQAKKLASILPSRFYRSREAMVEAARTHSMANLIDTDTGLKIDLSVLPTEPFYKAVMGRRRKVEYKPGGPGFWAVSPEYIVLMKLLRRQVTRSEKQWENALAVVRVQGAALDWAYLRRWADELHIAADMRALHTAAGI